MISTVASCGRFTLKELLDFLKNDLAIISVTGKEINYFFYKDSCQRMTIMKAFFFFCGNKEQNVEFFSKLNIKLLVMFYDKTGHITFLLFLFHIQ